MSSSKGYEDVGEWTEPFQSRNREAFCFKLRSAQSATAHPLWFQSRNREAFCFKGALAEVLRCVLSVMAIPRATHFGTLGDERNI